MSTYESNQNQTHSTSTVSDGFGEFTARCECGWTSGFESFDTKTAALGAGDRHIARTMD